MRRGATKWPTCSEFSDGARPHRRMHNSVQPRMLASLRPRIAAVQDRGGRTKQTDAGHRGGEIPADHASDREPLSGLVERVTFHSSETGLCVLRVKVRGHRDLVTVLGSAADIHSGEYVQASGRWERHRDHGMQFRALFLQVTAPTSLEGNRGRGSPPFSRADCKFCSDRGLSPGSRADTVCHPCDGTL